MPIVQIDMFEGRTLEQKRDMVQKVTEALVNTIGCEPEAVKIIIHNIKKEDVAESGSLLSDL